MMHCFWSNHLFVYQTEDVAQVPVDIVYLDEASTLNRIKLITFTEKKYTFEVLISTLCSLFSILFSILNSKDRYQQEELHFYFVLPLKKN